MFPWEQLLLTSFLQKYWSDNQVSCTVTFDPETEGKYISNALNYFQYQLKSISFLPKNNVVYKQMPYEEITQDQYNEYMSKIKNLDFIIYNNTDSTNEQFCDNDACTLNVT